MSALVNAFWILATCFLLAMLAVVFIIGAACLEKAQAEERENQARIAETSAKLSVDGYSRHELSRITAQVMRNDRKRPRNVSNRPGNWTIA